MRRRRMRRPSAGLMVGLVALFVALGGTSLAATLITGRDVKNGSLTGKDIKSGSLTGKQIKSGSLTGTQVKNGSLTGRQVQASSLGQVPSAANADRLGGRAAGAFESANRWILVQGTATGATVLAQSGGMSASRLATGQYSIDAGASVSRLPLTATINPTGGTGFVSAAPCGGNANNPGGTNCGGANDNSHVLVITQATNGAVADRTFYLTIGG